MLPQLLQWIDMWKKQFFELDFPENPLSVMAA